MVFSSQIFIFYFLPVVLAIYFALPFRARNAAIALASYVFYGWANPTWALILFFGTSVDYVAGLVLAKLSKLPDEGGLPPIIGPDVPRTRAMKIVVAISVLTNLGMLAVFKYTGFVTENVNALSRLLGLGDTGLPILHLVLPVGISFYTFKAMSYVIDVYRGHARPMRKFTDYMCFEAFFPDLVAGPIIRYASLEKQMREREHTLEKFARGVAFFAFGMAKKILLANPMGHIADAAFEADSLRAGDAWFGVTAYAFQIYFDFSGYSDMAIGLSLMLGFVLARNFDSPYKSENITEFWRRWHISLSTWLRDYVYIPLGGNRKGGTRTYVNLMLVMLIGGLWHGASWNFVIWGGIHGGMLAFERSQGKDGFYRRLPRPARVALTFAIVCVSWVFFRATTLGSAVDYLACMFGLSDAGVASDAVAGVVYTPYHTACYLICGLVVWTLPDTWTFTERLTPSRAVSGFALLAAAVLVMWTQTVNPFLYFQF
jgi:alginate O-acetyltransferase complex protein AlgI